MRTSFDDFIQELEAEARAAGPEAIAELEAFRLHFSLARQLAERRRSQKLTQEQLATRSGIDQAEISRIERGQANPTATTLGALTRALGVDVRLVPATRRRDDSAAGGARSIEAYLTEELRRRRLDEVPAVEAARWLDAAGVLKDSRSRPGLPLRNLLRERAISIAEQRPARPHGRWFIVQRS